MHLHIPSYLILVLHLLFLIPLLARSAYSPSTYDVDWDVPSSLESESMPLGNGDLTVNLWVNASTGALMYYAQTSSSFEENGQVLKLIRGRVDLGLQSTDFTDFHQHLHIHNASQTVTFTAGKLRVFALVWVDRYHSVVHFNLSTSQPVQATNSIEMWRTQPTPMGQNWQSGYTRHVTLHLVLPFPSSSHHHSPLLISASADCVQVLLR
jgi:hypothetical protein